MVDVWIETPSIYYWRAAGILFSILVLVVVFEIEKHRMDRLTSANTHSSILLLHKRHAGDLNYASRNEVVRIDGMRAQSFLYYVGVPAVYLAPGEHDLEVKATWMRHIRGKRFREYHAGPRHIRVTVGRGELWSLEYKIHENAFIVSRCKKGRVFKQAR